MPLSPLAQPVIRSMAAPSILRVSATATRSTREYGVRGHDQRDGQIARSLSEGNEMVGQT